jgi:hypothetical protein
MQSQTTPDNTEKKTSKILILMAILDIFIATHYKNKNPRRALKQPKLP